MIESTKNKNVFEPEIKNEYDKFPFKALNYQHVSVIISPLPVLQDFISLCSSLICTSL